MESWTALRIAWALMRGAFWVAASWAALTAALTLAAMARFLTRLATFLCLRRSLASRMARLAVSLALAVILARVIVCLVVRLIWTLLSRILSLRPVMCWVWATWAAILALTEAAMALLRRAMWEAIHLWSLMAWTASLFLASVSAILLAATARLTAARASKRVFLTLR